METTAPRDAFALESFADHYSQARLFFRSQTKPEQAHIASAITFELSKVGTPQYASISWVTCAISTPIWHNVLPTAWA